VGLTLAIEGFNIVNGWQDAGETMQASVGVAGLKENYINGDIGFDPLGLKPTKAGKRCVPLLSYVCIAQ
jgi:hypothetical protein